MTRSNLHITLSNGQSIICVADSSSAPEQGYFVENILLPLLSLNNSQQELEFLSEYCAMNERRINATYRYIIDVKTKKVEFFKEHYNYTKNTFRKGKDLTKRYNDYRELLGNN